MVKLMAIEPRGGNPRRTGDRYGSAALRSKPRTVGTTWPLVERCSTRTLGIRPRRAGRQRRSRSEV